MSIFDKFSKKYGQSKDGILPPKGLISEEEENVNLEDLPPLPSIRDLTDEDLKLMENTHFMYDPVTNSTKRKIERKRIPDKGLLPETEDIPTGRPLSRQDIPRVQIPQADKVPNIDELLKDFIGKDSQKRLGTDRIIVLCDVYYKLATH
jgi:hypothetical protein